VFNCHVLIVTRYDIEHKLEIAAQLHWERLEYPDIPGFSQLAERASQRLKM